MYVPLALLVAIFIWLTFITLLVLSGLEWLRRIDQRQASLKPIAETLLRPATSVNVV